MTFCDSRVLLSCRLFSLLFVNRQNYLCSSLRRVHMDNRDNAKSTMELSNIPPVVSLYRQAVRTFDVRYKNDLATNLSKLKVMMNTLKAEDLALDKTLIDPATWRKPLKAPCTYVEVFQSELLNMSIFILKPGFKMPLHDHPHMHGLLKVVAGAINIRSFTEHPLKEIVSKTDAATRAKLEAARIAGGIHKRRKLFAEVTQNQKCIETTATCVLTPTHSNFHEIEALEVPAAFFDILAPPYDTLIENIGPRRCRYYNVANEISTNVVELEEMEVPECFYCDQAPYLGPILS